MKSVPWLSQSAIDVIENFIQPGYKILEFGCGGSTLWFAEQKCIVFSVEHDEEWACKVTGDILKGEYDYPVTLMVHKRPYQSVVEPFMDNFFDLILVDGRDRNQCFKLSERTLKPGGLMILDDAHRAGLKNARTYAEEKGWARVDTKSVENKTHNIFHHTSYWIKT